MLHEKLGGEDGSEVVIMALIADKSVCDGYPSPTQSRELDKSLC